jgi:bifunctional DNA-binding transcriptional regulator/antitoxin component of YhaV-PrlF toxin-antitoxin module
MWYDSNMSHILVQSHDVRMGERGRLVLPAEIRRALRVEAGDHLVAWLDDGGVRLARRRQLAREARGPLRRLTPDRDLVGELLAERRAEAGRE